MRSRVKVTTMLLVLIFSLTAGFCSAKDNKPPDSKVTAFIHVSVIAVSPFFFYLTFKKC